MTCRSVLIVEDDDAIRWTMLELLRSENISTPVRAVGNGVEALVTLESMSKPCLVLLDLVLPVMTGWEFIEELKKCALVHDCQVVIMTALKLDREYEYPVIRKPMNLDFFVDFIRRACQSQPAQSANAHPPT